MVKMEALIPRWFQSSHEEEVYDMSESMPPPPAIAMLPLPEQSDEEKRLAAIATAHVYVEQLRQERASDKAENEQLRSDLKAEERKSGLLELDIAQHLNTIATLQSEVLALKAENERYRNFFSVQKQINEKERLTYERFGIGDLPKAERKARPKKAPKPAEPAL